MAKIIQEVFPCGLNKYDIYFLSRRVNLSNPKTVLLTEEETDLNLLLLQICSLPLTKRQTRNLSDLLLIKILSIGICMFELLSNDCYLELKCVNYYPMTIIKFLLCVL